MVSIAMFNNKGGVGKTTLTCNAASYFAQEKGVRVLVVDCDPQCNSTQLIMGEEFATEMYWVRSRKAHVTTVKEILQPIEDGDSTIETNVKPVLGSKNRFGVDLIPGHPGFSIIEDRLGSAWHELKGGDIGGIRKTNWNSALCALLRDSYDIVVFDLGPSLGSINRSVLLGCDRFITPMGADIFSILGIRNMAVWMEAWLKLYHNSLAICEERTPGRLAEYSIAADVAIESGYVGYTMQQYITKSKQGVRRPTKAYEAIISSVPDMVYDSLGHFFCPGMAKEDAKLGDVPHLYSLIPLAQSVSAPILRLESSDGLVGAQYQQREEYGEIISTISEEIYEHLELEE